MSKDTSKPTYTKIDFTKDRETTYTQIKYAFGKTICKHGTTEELQVFARHIIPEYIASAIYDLDENKVKSVKIGHEPNHGFIHRVFEKDTSGEEIQRYYANIYYKVKSVDGKKETCLSNIECRKTKKGFYAVSFEDINAFVREIKICNKKAGVLQEKRTRISTEEAFPTVSIRTNLNIKTDEEARDNFNTDFEEIVDSEQEGLDKKPKEDPEEDANDMDLSEDF